MPSSVYSLDTLGVSTGAGLVCRSEIGSAVGATRFRRVGRGVVLGSTACCVLSLIYSTAVITSSTGGASFVVIRALSAVLIYLLDFLISDREFCDITYATILRARYRF